MVPVLLVGLLASLGATAGSDPVNGYWWTEDREAIVEIAHTEEGPVGRIVWLLEPHYPDDDERAGEAVLDDQNPDPALRHRPVLGLRILEGFERRGEGDWRGGEIYDPDNGRTYRARMRIGDAGQRLDLRGYVGTPLLGRTARWNRYEAETLPDGASRYDGTLDDDDDDDKDKDKAKQ